MKFLKQKNISRYTVNDNTLIANYYGRAVMDLTGGLRLPKGTTAQRPQLSSVRTPNGANGYIRYNTSTNSLEAYIDGVWEVVRAPGATSITKQEIGPGDYSETLFGPLSQIPASADNILVFVENVFQISTTNFTLVQNPAGTPVAAFYSGAGSYPTGWYLQFTSAVPLDKYVTVYFGFAN